MSPWSVHGIPTGKFALQSSSYRTRLIVIWLAPTMEPVPNESITVPSFDGAVPGTRNGVPVIKSIKTKPLHELARAGDGAVVATIESSTASWRTKRVGTVLVGLIIDTPDYSGAREPAHG